jgi:hypothetical protein
MPHLEDGLLHHLWAQCPLQRRDGQQQRLDCRFRVLRQIDEGGFAIIYLIMEQQQPPTPRSPGVTVPTSQVRGMLPASS